MSVEEQRDHLLNLFRIGFGNGPKPIMQEAKLLLAPWGFDLTDAAYDPIRIWHGTNDVHAPIQQCREMASVLPHAQLKEYELDHPGMLDEVVMVLEDLMQVGTKPRNNTVR